MSVDIEFKDLPARGPSRSQEWAVVAEALKARPGEWAVVDRDAPATVATAIKRGRYSAFRPAGAFEATVRRSFKKDGVSTTYAAEIYARYVGGGNER